MEEKECPECGSRDIEQGKLSGYAAMRPKHRALSFGSAIIADVCTDCGEILSMKVEKPEQFKR
ncbi:hypothetical protein [Salinicoccus sp. YB14-2]|uniref:hypothetical protein n=1 Tax=Salinicoccus sp. YB14-2 TaxID=1572701 RepID=UPI000A9C2501|nr:hypothetical protein [Salinicoccus sp. YB14-2]